jgi:hypothetical protein
MFFKKIENQCINISLQENCKNRVMKRPVRLTYEPPASSTFLSEQTSQQQPANNTFLSE